VKLDGQRAADIEFAGLSEDLAKAANSDDPRSSTKRRILVPIGYYVASRISVFFVALATSWYFPALTPRSSFTGWDAGWMLRIAQFGYPRTLTEEVGGGNRWAFFPGVPALVRATAKVTGMSFSSSGLVVAFVTGLGAVIAAWYLASRFGTEVADYTALLLSFFPTAYVFSMVYSDGLFICCACATLVFLGRKRWLLAGLATSLASVTRGFGIILILACAAEAVIEITKTRKVRPVIGIATAPIGLVAWTWYQWNVSGDPFAYNTAYEYWFFKFRWFSVPFRSVWRLGTNAATWHNGQEVTSAAGLLFIAVGLGVLAVRHRRGHRVPVSWWIYAIGSALLAASPTFPVSVFRYSMSVVPALIGVACVLRPRHRGALIGLFATAQAAIAFVAFAGLLTWQTAPFAP
jgi:hypothetical protein